jgi:hypothetical protein
VDIETSTPAISSVIVIHLSTPDSAILDDSSAARRLLSKNGVVGSQSSSRVDRRQPFPYRIRKGLPVIQESLRSIHKSRLPITNLEVGPRIALRLAWSFISCGALGTRDRFSTRAKRSPAIHRDDRGLCSVRNGRASKRSSKAMRRR